MRIVHVSNFFGPRSGGRDATLNALGAGYQHAGHEFFGITPGTTNTWSHTGTGTRITISVPNSDGRRFSETAAAILHTVDRLAPDRLEVADRLTFRSLGAWASKTNTPAVFLTNGSPATWSLPPLAGNETATRGKRDERSTAPLARFGRVISTTRTGEESLRAVLPSVADRIPLGVDLETFTPLRWSAEQRAELLGDGEVLLVHAGRLAVHKRALTSINVLRELLRRGVDARLTVVGDGPLRRRLERSARDLPVTFTGHISDRRDVAQILASADIALVPDPTDRFSRSILEALASGTAVVAGRSATASELLTNSSGAVSGSSVPEFAGAIQNILALPVEDRRADARDAAARFPWAQTVATMLAIHESSDAVSGWSELAPLPHLSA